MNRKELNNSSITNEFYTISGNENRVLEVFKSYDGRRSKENYSLESFRFLIQSNRFNYGLVETYCDGKLVCFSGFSIYRNWVSTTRYISFSGLRIPFYLGSCIPFLLSRIENENFDGIFFSINEHNLMLKMLIQDDLKRFHTDEKILEHHLFQEKKKVIGMMKTIEHPVVYRMTKQYIVYIPLRGKEPSFEPFISNSP